MQIKGPARHSTEGASDIWMSRRFGSAPASIPSAARVTPGSGSQAGLAGDERRPAGGAALLGIVVGEQSLTYSAAAGWVSWSVWWAAAAGLEASRSPAICTVG